MALPHKTLFFNTLISCNKTYYDFLIEEIKTEKKEFIDTRNYLLRFFIKGYKGVYYGIYWYLLKGNIK
jgi:hypothetical protein